MVALVAMPNTGLGIGGGGHGHQGRDHATRRGWLRHRRRRFLEGFWQRHLADDHLPDDHRRCVRAACRRTATPQASREILVSPQEHVVLWSRKHRLDVHGVEVARPPQAAASTAFPRCHKGHVVGSSGLCAVCLCPARRLTVLAVAIASPIPSPCATVTPAASAAAAVSADVHAVQALRAPFLKVRTARAVAPVTAQFTTVTAIAAVTAVYAVTAEVCMDPVVEAVAWPITGGIASVGEIAMIVTASVVVPLALSFASFAPVAAPLAPLGPAAAAATAMQRRRARSRATCGATATAFVAGPRTLWWIARTVPAPLAAAIVDRWELLLPPAARAATRQAAPPIRATESRPDGQRGAAWRVFCATRGRHGRCGSAAAAAAAPCAAEATSKAATAATTTGGAGGVRTGGGRRDIGAAAMLVVVLGKENLHVRPVEHRADMWSIIRFLLQQDHDQFGQSRAVLLRNRLRLRGANHEGHGWQVPCMERHLETREFVEDDAKGPYVGLYAVWIVLANLRRQIRRSPDRGVCLAHGAVYSLGDAEVPQLNGAFAEVVVLADDENVCRLEVAVEDFPRVDEVQGGTDLNKGGHDRLFREPPVLVAPLLDPPAEIAAVGILHDNVQHVNIYDHVVASDDVLVGQSSKELTFRESLLPAFLIRPEYAHLLRHVLVLLVALWPD
mmetsp:Transcript_47115/g.118672  ORF Transcript_47115/g.118672 Transcript_47115/m.118672 type:complete len:673 (+) Transcript_47115:925-2943(+)